MVVVSTHNRMHHRGLECEWGSIHTDLGYSWCRNLLPSGVFIRLPGTCSTWDEEQLGWNHVSGSISEELFDIL